MRSIPARSAGVVHFGGEGLAADFALARSGGGFVGAGVAGVGGPGDLPRVRSLRGDWPAPAGGSSPRASRLAKLGDRSGYYQSSRGSGGGLDLKQALAKELGVQLLVIDRPSIVYPAQTDQIDEVVAFAHRAINL